MQPPASGLLWHGSRTSPAVPGRFRLRRSLERLLRPLALSLLLASTGCSDLPRAEDRSAGGRPLVLTTFLPITLFTRAVAGDCAEVRSLIPPQVGPHDFQARPSDLVALRRARVLVSNGLGIEAFLERLLASEAGAGLRLIDTSRGIAPLSRQLEVGQAVNDPDGEASHPQDEAGHRHGPVNPHIWLDPRRAAQQVIAIRDGLIAADPRCAASYRRNAERTLASLKRLDLDLTRQLQPYRGRAFVASHDFAPYFAERYGLQAEFLVEVPDLPPSPGDLQRVATIVKRQRLRALLSEPKQSDRALESLARDLGIGIALFDGLETGSQAMEDSASAGDPGAYLTLMRANANRLNQVFAP